MEQPRQPAVTGSVLQMVLRRTCGQPGMVSLLVTRAHLGLTQACLTGTSAQHAHHTPPACTVRRDQLRGGRGGLTQACVTGASIQNAYPALPCTGCRGQLHGGRGGRPGVPVRYLYARKTYSACLHRTLRPATRRAWWAAWCTCASCSARWTALARSRPARPAARRGCSSRSPSRWASTGALSCHRCRPRSPAAAGRAARRRCSWRVSRARQLRRTEQVRRLRRGALRQARRARRVPAAQDRSGRCCHAQWTGSRSHAAMLPAGAATACGL
jgi:hypothetical protein